MAGHEAAVRTGRDAGRLPGPTLSALLKSALSQEVGAIQPFPAAATALRMACWSSCQPCCTCPWGEACLSCFEGKIDQRLRPAGWLAGQVDASGLADRVSAALGARRWQERACNALQPGARLTGGAAVQCSWAAGGSPAVALPTSKLFLREQALPRTHANCDGSCLAQQYNVAGCVRCVQSTRWPSCCGRG
jgi:hypothetical protein